MQKQRKIALAQHKGGVGKTTCTLGLALVAQEAGKRCMVVDLDSQRIASRVIKTNDLELPVVSRLDSPDVAHAELVFIDTPGLQAHETAQALEVADVVVIPLRPSMLDWFGTSHVIAALQEEEHQGRTVLWLPSQLDSRRAADRAIFGALADAVKNGDIPNWPVLPGIRALASVTALLQGKMSNAAADNFRDNFKKLRRYL